MLDQKTLKQETLLSTQLHNYVADFIGFYGSAGWRQSGLTGAHHGKPPPQTYVEPSAEMTPALQCEAKTSRCRSPSLQCFRRETGPGRRLCRSAGNAAGPPRRAPAPPLLCLRREILRRSHLRWARGAGVRQSEQVRTLPGVNVLWCREWCAPRRRSRTRWQLRCQGSDRRIKGPGRLPPGAAARRR